MLHKRKGLLVHIITHLDMFKGMHTSNVRILKICNSGLLCKQIYSVVYYKFMQNIVMERYMYDNYLKPILECTVKLCKLQHKLIVV